MFSLIIAMLASVGIVGGTVAAVGGGGGGGGGAAAAAVVVTVDDTWTVTTAQADVYRTTEYDNQWGLEAIKSAQAYASLAKNSKPIAGDDVKIAILDTGTLSTHLDITDNYSATGSYDYVNTDSDPSDDEGHGTNVAGIAAGVKNARGTLCDFGGSIGIIGCDTHGVAYNSTLIAEKVLDLIGDGSGEDIGAGISGAAVAGAKVINLSLGGSSDSAISAGLLVAKAADVVTVASTGNDNATNPDYPAAYASVTAFQGYIIAVGAVDIDDITKLGTADESFTIADFSNECGTAKDYCLVAPGVDIVGAYTTSLLGTYIPSYAIADGTSQAAPHVSGAAAILRAAWPALTAPQVVEILLDSATDLGATGVDVVYGHGLLNLYAAVQAHGVSTISSGSVITAPGYEASSSSFVSDAIFGDAFARNVAPQLNKAIFLDSYGRDYKAFLGDKISSKSSTVTSLNNLTFNNYSTKNIPLNFGQNSASHLNFQFNSYANADNSSANSLMPPRYSVNKYGFKSLTIDKSKEDRLLTNSGGFSFSQDFSKEFKAGFAFNFDEISNSRSNQNIAGFITVNNFAANPYQSFIGQSSAQVTQADQQRNFNQFFVTQKFFDDKFAFNFSYQNSYQSSTILSKLNNRENQISDFNFIYLPGKDSNISVSFGNLTEFNNNFLNSKAAGAFEAAGDTKTSYFKIASVKKLFGNLSLISSFSEGSTKAGGNNMGVFRDYENVRSRSSSIGLVQDKILGGKLGVVYSEPLRVYSGKVKIDVPTSRDIAGNLTRYTADASLVPDGKERDLEMFYSRDLNRNSTMKFNLIVQKQPNNFKDAKNNNLGFVSYNLKF